MSNNKHFYKCECVENIFNKGVGKSGMQPFLMAMLNISAIKKLPRGRGSDDNSKNKYDDNAGVRFNYEFFGRNGDGMIDRKDLYVGKQIVFDDGNREPEHGIVSSWNSKPVFCRFFRDERPLKLKEIRTIANSEACEYSQLWAFPLPQEKIDSIVAEMRSDPEKYGWVEQETEKQNDN